MSSSPVRTIASRDFGTNVAVSQVTMAAIVAAAASATADEIKVPATGSAAGLSPHLATRPFLPCVHSPAGCRYAQMSVRRVSRHPYSPRYDAVKILRD
jgi:hypothetical protein